MGTAPSSRGSTREAEPPFWGKEEEARAGRAGFCNSACGVRAPKRRPDGWRESVVVDGEQGNGMKVPRETSEHLHKKLVKVTCRCLGRSQQMLLSNLSQQNSKVFVHGDPHGTCSRTEPLPSPLMQPVVWAESTDNSPCHFQELELNL